MPIALKSVRKFFLSQIADSPLLAELLASIENFKAVTEEWEKYEDGPRSKRLRELNHAISVARTVAEVERLQSEADDLVGSSVADHPAQAAARAAKFTARQPMVEKTLMLLTEAERFSTGVRDALSMQEGQFYADWGLTEYRKTWLHEYLDNFDRRVAGLKTMITRVQGMTGHFHPIYNLVEPFITINEVPPIINPNLDIQHVVREQWKIGKKVSWRADSDAGDDEVQDPARPFGDLSESNLSARCDATDRKVAAINEEVLAEIAAIDKTNQESDETDRKIAAAHLLGK
jgi:hypothetical protein